MENNNNNTYCSQFVGEAKTQGSKCETLKNKTEGETHKHFVMKKYRSESQADQPDFRSGCCKERVEWERAAGCGFLGSSSSLLSWEDREQKTSKHWLSFPMILSSQRSFYFFFCKFEILGFTVDNAACDGVCHLGSIKWNFILGRWGRE